MTERDNINTEDKPLEPSGAQIAEGFGMAMGAASFFLQKIQQGALRALNNYRAHELGITPEELLARESAKTVSKHPGSRADMKRINATREACEQINKDILEGNHLDAQGKLTRETYGQLVEDALGAFPHQVTLSSEWKAVPKRYKRRGRPDEQ